MPTFTAPALHTTIDRAIYESQLNSNFSKINTAFISLQNIIPTIAGAGLQPSNLLWVERAILPDGVLGTDGFTPVFTMSTDGDTLSLDVTHPGEAATSAAIMQSVYHRATTVKTVDLTSLTTTSDETIEISIGLLSAGAPSLEIVVGENVTDFDSDLILYTFDLTVSGGTFWQATNLRRVADVLMDRESWTKIWDGGETINFQNPGSLGQSVGLLPGSFVAPYDCQVVEAHFDLGTAAGSGETITAELVSSDNLTDGNILASTASWASPASGVLLRLGLTPNVLVSKGSRIQCNLTVADDSTDSVGGDLNVTVLIRRIYHEIR